MLASKMDEGHLAAPPATATDTFVDVQLLIDRPKAALLGVLKFLEGWESVSALPAYCSCPWHDPSLCCEEVLQRSPHQVRHLLY
jgi:hypothetical protein